MTEAYVLIMARTGAARSLLSDIREIEGVRRANVVAGEFDVIADVEAGSNQELLRLVTDRIQSLEDVGRTRTCIVLE